MGSGSWDPDPRCGWSNDAARERDERARATAPHLLIVLCTLNSSSAPPTAPVIPPFECGENFSTAHLATRTNQPVAPSLQLALMVLIPAAEVAKHSSRECAPGKLLELLFAVCMRCCTNTPPDRGRPVDRAARQGVRLHQLRGRAPWRRQCAARTSWQGWHRHVRRNPPFGGFLRAHPAPALCCV